MNPTPSHSKVNGAATRAASAAFPGRLDELLELDPHRLAAFYATATVPKLANLTGDLRGRMLAWHGVGGLPAALRALGRWDRFPWRGKSFQHASASEGDGDNRVIADRWHLFRFTTSIGPSRAGAFDAVHLDYDHPGNPFFIRAIHDELRQLRLNLYLGQAYLIRPFAPRLLLYFGLERRQAS